MKQIISKWLLSFTCVWLLLASACKDDAVTPSTDPVPPILTTEGLPDEALHFLYSAQTPQTFTLSVDAPWEVTKTAGWFVVSPRTGKAGENIVITITPDFNEGDARTGEFTIRANSGNNLKPCITEKVVKMAQDAYMAAGITVAGLTSETLVFAAKQPQSISFQVNATYNWELTTENGSWVTIQPKTGLAETETTVTITPTENTTDSQRSAKVSITAIDPNNPANVATKELSLIQSPYFEADTHAEGYTFFNEDFSWIPQNWVSPYSKYGWPSVNVDGTNGNEFALSTSGMKEVVEGKGYLYTASNYARYEGHIKLGKTNQMGSISTPAISGIDESKSATLLLQFDAALYSSAGGTVDSGDNKFYISVDPPATVGGLVEQESSVEMANVWSWTRYSVLIYNATSETRITLGSEKTVTCRLYLDNITVKRAKDNGAVAPAPKTVDTPLDKELINTTPAELFNKEKKFVNTGGTFSGSIRLNRAWTAEPDCDWLTITAVKCGAPTSTAGVNNGATLANGIASVTATALPYNDTHIEVTRNTGEERTGNILIKVDGQVVDKITITQEKGMAIWFQYEDLTDYTLELPYTAQSELKFKVTASHAWIITPDNSDWYSVNPASGAANTKVEITVKATKANTGMRRFGSFAIKASAGSDVLEETVDVMQEPAGIGSVKWDLSTPIAWAFSATDMVNYTLDFKGLASDVKSRNALPAKQGPGYISYVHTYPGLHTKCERIVGATGEPYVTGAWPGDYWSFLVPVANLPAGTKIRFTGTVKASGTGHKYWKLEYNDGGVWKPATAILTKTVGSEVVSYTHEMMNTAALPIDLTVTYANSISNGNVEFRLTCAANWQASNSGPLTEPNGGTFRFTGAAASPKIEVVQ